MNQSDIRTTIISGVLVLGDGSLGGGPLSGIDFGLPSGNLASMTRVPSGIAGDTLPWMMSYFPDYTQVRHDRTSIGAQFLTSVSNMADRLTYEQIIWNAERFPQTHPLYEQGVVYEWDYNENSGLQAQPPVSGRLGSLWFDVPLARDEYSFWMAPPTRLETTSETVSGFVLLDWTMISGSGNNVLIQGPDILLPIDCHVVVETSGFTSFINTLSDAQRSYGGLYIHGKWASDSFRERAPRIEEIPIGANTPLFSSQTFRAVSSITTKFLQVSGWVKVTAFNFNPKWRADAMLNYYADDRVSPSVAVFWQVMGKNTSFSGIVQPEFHTPITAGDESYLVRSRLITDTIHDEDLEWEPTEAWRLAQPDGTPISGVVDFAPVPWSHYLMLLDGASRVWVVDTYREAVDMRGLAPTRSCPVKLSSSWPKDASETPSRYTVQVEAEIINSVDGIGRTRWGLHHNGVFGWLENWNVGDANSNGIPRLDHVVSGVGTYVFELQLKTDTGKVHRTYIGHQQVEKRALGALPVRGLPATPSGIDFDAYGRPWFLTSGIAQRAVMRTDVGMWLPEERVLLTREPYEEVRV